MFTKLTTTLMVGALALATTITPTQVRADNDAAKIIGGLAIGAIIGAAIADNNDNRRHNRGHVSRRHHDAYDVYGRGNHRSHKRGHHRSHKRGHYRGHDRGYHRGHRGHDGYKHRRVNLPGACRVHKGHRSGYSGRCLGRHNYSYSALPSACAVRVGGHHRTIYRDGCLNRYGYY